MSEFKVIASELLTPHTSAILLDPEYGLEAIKRRAPNAGVFLAYEKTGYDATVKGRLPDLLPEWSVRRLVAAGANVIKILLYDDPDDNPAIRTIKHAFIERVGAECRANDVPFFLEPIAYSDAIGDDQGIAFARVKPDKVTQYLRQFSQPHYGVDVLKVEVPVNVRYVEGSRANTDGRVAYSRAEAMEHFRAAAAATQVPFIYLSAGVSDAVFRATLELAAEAGTPFSGVLCGRASWQDGIPEYGKGGAGALRAWLSDRGMQNIQALNDSITRFYLLSSAVRPALIPVRSVIICRSRLSAILTGAASGRWCVSISMYRWKMVGLPMIPGFAPPSRRSSICLTTARR